MTIVNWYPQSYIFVISLRNREATILLHDTDISFERMNTNHVLVVNVAHLLLYTVFMQVSHNSGCGNDAAAIIREGEVTCLSVTGTTPVSCGSNMWYLWYADHHGWHNKLASIVS